MLNLRRLHDVAVATALGMVPVAALASEGAEAGGHAPGPGSLMWYWVNFALLIGILVWKGLPAMNTFLADRKEKVLGDLRAAEKLRDEARAKLAELEAKIGRVESDVKAILDDTLRGAEAERARIIEAAEETAKRIRSQATLMVEQEVRRAREDLSREVTESAAREAASILRDAFSDADQDRLVREFTTTEGVRS
ncbi:MAG: ATP synthase F0 subunit B [Deltaproteobacteria bacterium]|nr:ATP synthase F0 subunit B [Deltaproteobacteria bacterium]